MAGTRSSTRKASKSGEAVETPGDQPVLDTGLKPSLPKKRGRPPKPKPEADLSTAVTPISDTPDHEIVPQSPNKISDLDSLPTSAPVSARRAGLRMSNDPHPGVSAGVDQRTQEVISAQAEKKRVEKEALVAKKIAELEVQKREWQKKIDALAQFELNSAVDPASFEHLLADEDMLQDEPQDDADVPPDITTSSEEPQEEPGSEGDEGSDYGQDDNVAVVGMKASTAGKRKATTTLVPLPKKAKITKKDQRRELRTSVNSAKNLKTAENREPVIAVGGRVKPSSTRPKSVVATSKATPPPRSTAITGLKTHWRSEITGRTSSPAAASSASSAPTPKNSDITRLRKGAAAAAHRRTESSETIGGFTDKDVTIQRNDTTKHQYVQMVKIDEDCGGTSQLPKKRAAKSVVSEDKSLSYESLPEWAKVHWRLVLIPTLLDVIGSQENPWEFDRQSNSDPLLALIQELVDSIYPEDHEDLDSKSKVFRIARQAICNWRSGFIKAAHAIIEKDIRMRKLNTADVQEFVRSALVHGTGYAFWENPGEGASGALKSPYILKTFATHITATEGSQAASLELADWQRGALALAATAVEHKL
ncbi:hypothetical protein B0H21DRAFT_824597 [Amylocystis lapponica]|nr:hypothetical protein B0H21DRAFT_824597 [Amylocystis lapponica]